MVKPALVSAKGKMSNNQKAPILISATELNRRSGEMLRRVALQNEQIIIERDGYPLAVMISIETYKRLVGGAGGVLSESEEVGA